MKFEHRYLIDILATVLLCAVVGFAVYFAPAFN